MHIVYQILEILPTRNLSTIKAAFEKKIERLKINLADKGVVDALVEAFHSVETQEALNQAYYDSVHEDLTASIDTENVTVVFIPVRVRVMDEKCSQIRIDNSNISFEEAASQYDEGKVSQSLWRSKRILVLPKYNKEQIDEFDGAFNWEALAECINFDCLGCTFQVGLTRQEAQQIVNLHSHYYKYLIAEVCVPKASVSSLAISERAKFGLEILSARTENHFWLAQKTKIDPKQIISVSAMGEYAYKNSCKFFDKASIEACWPCENHVTLNPQMISQSADLAQEQCRPISP